MRNLNVLQVAHHGGWNGHFYRVIDKAGVANFQGPLYLLLSYEKGSKVRPAAGFASYKARLGSVHPAKLLFTNPPATANTADYRVLAAPPTIGSAKPHGDARLRFDGLSWIVGQYFVTI